ncbi:MAG: hypothetical protein ACQETK_02290 [Pseudomonadota bacterium]
MGESIDPETDAETPPDLRGLVEQARRRFWLHARASLLAEMADFDLGTAFATMAQRHRHTDIRILIDDDLELKDQMPAVVDSIKRLTTAISVRRLRPAEESPEVVTAIADQSGWLQLTRVGSNRVLRGATEDRAGAARLALDFEANWMLSEEASELRRVLV